MTASAPQAESTQLVRHPNSPSAEMIEQVVIRGDLSPLNPQQRSEYYAQVCNSLGLNPLTKPFDYLEMKDGKGGKKLVLYAKRDATDQLRSMRNVSLRIVAREQIGNIYIVTVRAMMGTREDEATGAVPLTVMRDGKLRALTDEELSNAVLKAETKAKRRVTLSICGLGWLDETEIPDPAAAAFPSDDEMQPAAVHHVAPRAAEPQPTEVASTENDGASSEAVVVQSVRIAKTGKGDKGDWKLIVVKFSDGAEAKTFSETVAQAAKALMESRTPVDYETEDTDKGTNLVFVRAR